MRIVGIFMFIFLGVTSIIGLAALDDTWFSFILGVCAYLGGLVSGVLLFIDRVQDADSYYKAFLIMQDERNEARKEITKLKSEV